MGLKMHSEKQTVYFETLTEKVPKDWKVVRLESIIKFKNGSRPEFSNTGNYKIYGANGVMGKTDKCIIDKDFTLIVGRVGASGEIHLATGKFWVSDNAIYSESYDSKNINMKFIFYLLSYKNLKRLATKSTHPILTQTQLNRYPIPLPPLPEQQKIAEILGMVDKAIQKVDEAIEKTKRIKKGLMQELLTKGIGHKEFKDTEIGRIPKEWEVKKVIDLFGVKTGTTPSTKKDGYWRNGDILWITPSDLSKLKDRIYIDDSSRKITEAGLNDTNLSLLPKNSIILSTRAPVGYVSLLSKKASFNQGCKGLVPHTSKNISSEFYANYFLNKKKNLEDLSGGSTFKELKKSILENFKIPFLSFPEQKKIAEILSTIDKKLRTLRLQKRKYEKIKKGLMQDLLTGKRRSKV